MPHHPTAPYLPKGLGKPRRGRRIKLGTPSDPLPGLKTLLAVATLVALAFAGYFRGDLDLYKVGEAVATALGLWGIRAAVTRNRPRSPA